MLAALVFTYYKIVIPFFGIDSKAMLGSFFFYVGYSIKNNQRMWNIASSWYFLIMTLIIVPLVAAFIPSSMVTLKFETIIPYTISALLASVTLLTSINRLNMTLSHFHKIIIYVGRNTLSILTWHFLSFKIVSLVIVVLYGLPIAQWAYFPSIQEYSRQGWWVVYTIAGVSIPLFMSYVISLIKKIL